MICIKNDNKTDQFRIKSGNLCSNTFSHSLPSHYKICVRNTESYGSLKGTEETECSLEHLRVKEIMKNNSKYNNSMK